MFFLEGVDIYLLVFGIPGIHFHVVIGAPLSSRLNHEVIEVDSSTFTFRNLEWEVYTRDYNLWGYFMEFWLIFRHALSPKRTTL